MKIRARSWLIFIILSVLCFGLWYKLEYPRFAFMRLSFSKQQACLAAENYLLAKGVDITKYTKAVVFEADEEFNRFLQHATGLKGEEDFISQHDFDLFFWKIRFFKELEQQEYVIYTSPRTGKIIGFTHLIEGLEYRLDLGRDVAKRNSELFLKNNFNIDLEKYDFHAEKIKRYENRTEYSFSWEKKGVYVPWKQGQGGAKLLVEVTVAGDEIRKFYKNDLELPDKFLRYVENQLVLGEYLYRIFYFLLLGLLACSISIALRRKQNFVPRLTKKWYYYVSGFLVVINVVDIFNNLQNIIMVYPTSANLSSFLGLSIMKVLFNVSFLTLSFIMPGIAGESICSEVFPKNKYSVFFSYIKSGFFNRGMASPILLGYIIWIMMLGMQAVIFYFGQRFLGVWREWHTMTDLSSSCIPLLSMFVISVTASLKEEIIFRLFGISLAKKYLKNSILAIVVISFIWGMGHSMYAVFPVWFRIVEITLIGIFYGFIFLRFGIMPLIIAHYLFNIFWCSAAYILGHSTLYLFFGSVGALFIPLGFAFIAYFLNRERPDNQLHLMLDKTQEYNLQILITFITAKKNQGVSSNLVREELIRYNWDHTLVNLAIEKVFTNH
jgi:hypothetical protein